MPLPRLPKPPRLPRAKEPIRPRPVQPPGELAPKPEEQEDTRRARWEAFTQRYHASYPEFIAYEWLTRVKRMEPERDFHFQYQFHGGRTFKGGQVLDFFFPRRNLAWMVQGLHYHYKTPAQKMYDSLLRLSIESRGIRAVELFEDDLEERPHYVLEKALQGIQVSRSPRFR